MGLERDPAWIRFLPVSVRPYLAGRNNLHAAMHNSGWLLFDKLVRLMLGLLVGAWVARYLGPAQYGELAYALAYIAFFQTVSTLGLDSIVVRDLVIHPEREAQILGTAFTLRFACGIFSWLVAVLGMAVISGWSDRSVLLVLLAGGSLVFQAADTVDLWFQSRSQSRRTVVAKLAAYLLSGGVKVALIVAEAPLAAFAAVLAFEAMSAALGLFFSYRRFRCSQPWRLVWVQGRQLLDESWPFILSGLSIMAYIRIDQIMIKEMLGERALGIYAVILPLSTFWQIIPTTFSVSLAPFIAKQRLAGEAQYRKTIVLVFRAFFYLGVFVALSTYFVSGWLVPLLFGTQYSEAVEILNVHVISNVFCFMGIAHNLWLVNERHFAVRLYGTVLAGISAVGINFLTLPWLGLIGASLAAIVAQALAAFLINVLLDRTSFWMQIEAITFRKIKQC